eukprot:3837662-Pyramimonas_sp.AAC.1
MASFSFESYFGARDRKSVKALAVIHLNITIYALCYWMAQRGRSGWLQTAFSAAQLLGGPIIGRICDAQGARLALILAQVFSIPTPGVPEA